MAVETSRTSRPVAALSDHKLLVGAIAAGVLMILLARFVLEGVIAGMFGVWGISLVLISVGSHLFLRAWGAYNR
ncbi:hypothetical protein SAMN04488063_3304 [Halopelagius inordinatus]|uniref:Uncharacterized protein n=1 Tax=Halopelagius inordinatus TaxID=553467 RepID=A0A1I2VRN5_9EURY|nr:hypothetical protein [Halopelagius inordinatus]SFG91984.1 hypothetical protein SAMN04488063_3304 [Halopelagius inordinatus]